MLLGRPASVRGQAGHDPGRTSDLGFPTVRLITDPEGFVPPDGVYAGWLVDQGSGEGLRHGQRYPAVIKVGLGLSSLEATPCKVEAYLLDESDMEVYGHDVEMPRSEEHTSELQSL